MTCGLSILKKEWSIISRHSTAGVNVSTFRLAISMQTPIADKEFKSRQMNVTSCWLTSLSLFCGDDLSHCRVGCGLSAFLSSLFHTLRRFIVLYTRSLTQPRTSALKHERHFHRHRVECDSSCCTEHQVTVHLGSLSHSAVSSCGRCLHFNARHRCSQFAPRPPTMHTVGPTSTRHCERHDNTGCRHIMMLPSNQSHVISRTRGSSLRRCWG